MSAGVLERKNFAPLGCIFQDQCSCLLISQQEVKPLPGSFLVGAERVRSRLVSLLDTAETERLLRTLRRFLKDLAFPSRDLKCLPCGPAESYIPANAGSPTFSCNSRDARQGRQN